MLRVVDWARRDPAKSGWSITPAAVESEIRRLFSTGGADNLVIRVQGAAASSEGREDAFRELLESLAMYHEEFRETREILVEPPRVEAIARTVAVLAQAGLQKRLFERVLWTFGRGIIEPLGAILEVRGDEGLLRRMQAIRRQLLDDVQKLRLSDETQQLLAGDLEKLLTDEYLQLLSDHEEKVQRPRAEALARETLHLIGLTFQRAFRAWPEHATRIAESVHRRFSGQMSLRECPLLIRQRIVEGIEGFLWVETGTELEGALSQLYGQPQYRGLLGGRTPSLGRELYHDFAEACWELVAEQS